MILLQNTSALKTTIYVFLLINICACSINRELNKSIKTFNFTKINSEDSIAYAKVETSNLQYKQFLNAQKKLNLSSLQQVRVHSEAWVSEYTYSYQEPMRRNYFKHPSFDHHPVVNINFTAAQKYCEWLTKEYNKENIYFRLPTKSEYLKLLQTVNIKYDSDNPNDYSEFNFNMKFEQNYPIDGSMYTARPDYFKYEKWIETPRSSYTQNKFGIKNIVGNVAELLHDGTYIGGSWDSFPAEVLDNPILNRPLPTVGFRVIRVEK